MSDGSIKVTPPELIQYGSELVSDGLAPLGDLAGAIEDIVNGTMKGLVKANDVTLPFPEGVSAMQMVKRNLDEFQNFLDDVKNGMTAIQSAATAMAVAYATADGDSANSISAVDFAFADGGRTPSGFPTKGVSTMEAQQEAADAAAGKNTLASAAVSDPNSVQPTSTYQIPGGTVYVYSDGSSLQVTSTSSSYGPVGSSTSTVYTVTDGKGVAQVTTKTKSEDYYSGNTTRTESVQTRTENGGKTTATTETTVKPDGSVSVTTSGTDADGKPVKPTTVNAAPPPKVTGSAAPKDSVRALEDEYGTQGDAQYYQKYGQY